MGRTEHFFHGTTAAMSPGDLITPANDRGVDSIRHASWHDVGSRAFATPNETTAWSYAFDSVNREPGSKDLPGPQHGRPRVYAVDPVGPHAPGPEHHPIFHQEAVAAAWRVRHELHTPDLTQGALPNLNWNQFRTDHDFRDTHREANSQLAHLRELDRRETERAPQPEPKHPQVHGQGRLF